MKKSIVLILLAALVAAPSAFAQGEAAGEQPAKPETTDDRAAYAIGLNMGSTMKAQGVDLDLDYLVQGLEDGLAGTDPVLSQEEIQTAMQEFQQTMMAKQQEMAQAEGEKNTAAGNAFREQNGAREGVETTDSGIQYEVLTAGDGPMPTASDRVRVHYKGTLVDGEQFDSSYDRGQPAVFPVGGVIQGWQEVIQLMPVGSKWKVVIPPELAYGERGSPPVIGPQSTLVFEIELLGIEDTDAAEAAEG